MGKSESPSSPRRVRRLNRERIVVEERIRGKKYREIAQIIAREEGSPKPLCLAAISRLMSSAMAKQREHNIEAIEELRALELARLDKLIEGIWDNASTGDLDSIKQMLSILDRRYKLLNLEPPQRVDANIHTAWAHLVVSAQRRLQEIEANESLQLEAPNMEVADDSDG